MGRLKESTGPFSAMSDQKQYRRVIASELDTVSIEKEAFLIAEEPLEIRVNGAPYAVTMRTPGNEMELVAGFCLTEGIVDSFDEIRAIGSARMRDGGHGECGDRLDECGCGRTYGQNRGYGPEPGVENGLRNLRRANDRRSLRQPLAPPAGVHSGGRANSRAPVSNVRSPDSFPTDEGGPRLCSF